MRFLLLAMLLAPCAAGCKHSTSSSSASHTETQTTTESTSSETGNTTTVTTTSEAPSRTTTTVEDYSNGSDSSGDVPVDAGERELGIDVDGGVAVAMAAPQAPRLVRRTVTVTERGAETTETHQQAVTQAQGATETKAAAKGDVTAKAHDEGGPSAGCIGASWIWGLAVLVGVVGVVYFAIKMRKVV